MKDLLKSYEYDAFASYLLHATTPRFASNTPPAGDVLDGATTVPSTQRGAGILTEPSAFTVSFATAKTVVECDYLGIVSANDTPDKLERAGFHTVKSEFVDAPVISELPMTLECKLLKFNEDGICIGEIVNISADESILNEDGKVDAKKLDPIIYDSVTHAYRNLGEKVGQAFSDGKKIQ